MDAFIQKISYPRFPFVYEKKQRNYWHDTGNRQELTKQSADTKIYNIRVSNSNLAGVFQSKNVQALFYEQSQKKKYFDPKQTYAYGGKHCVVKGLKNIVKKNDASDWLSQTDTYTLHKPARKKFFHRKYIVSGLYALWQADLG